MTPATDYLIVARIVAPFGIRGEVKAEVLTDFPDRLARRSTVFLSQANNEPRQFTLQGVRFHQGQALLSFTECTDRTAAEQLRGWLVQIPAADAPPLPQGTYYLHQIIGLSVYSPDDRHWGTITDILTAPAHHIYVVKTGSGDILVPAVPEYVKQVDIEERRIIIDMTKLG